MTSLDKVLLFAGTSLLIFGALYAFNLRGQFLLRRDANRQQKGGDTNTDEAPKRRAGFHFSITFARLYALMTIGVVGAALAFSSVDNSVVSAAYTLLGTIAGYLAGAKPQAVPGPDGNQEQEL